MSTTLTPDRLFELIMTNVRAGLLTAEEAATRLREVQVRLELVITQQANQEAMTQLRALKLAQLAVDFYLTGSVSLDRFNLEEITAAHNLLQEQRSVMPKEVRRHRDAQTSFSAYAVLGWLKDRLEGWPDKKKLGKGILAMLTKTKEALPPLIARLEAAYDDYWQDFTVDVFEEIDDILEAK